MTFAISLLFVVKGDAHLAPVFHRLPEFPMLTLLPNDLNIAAMSHSVARSPSEVETVVIDASGAVEGDFGPAGAGVVLSASGYTVKSVQQYCGDTDIEGAHYAALVLGLDAAIELGFMRVTVRTPSKLIALQMNRVSSVCSIHLIEPYRRALALSKEFAEFEIVHVPQTHITDAEDLARRAITSNCCSISKS